MPQRFAHLFCLTLALGTLFIPMKPVLALSFQDVIVFPAGTQPKDTSSGNHIDFFYSHSFWGLDFYESILDSGSLELTHLGNSNEGPQTEIWSIILGETTLGILTESLKISKTDIWAFPPEILPQISAQGPSVFPIALSELTSFNGEKIDLIQSKLEIKYHKIPSQERVLATPEISSLWSLGVGLGTLLRRRKNGRKLRAF